MIFQIHFKPLKLLLFAKKALIILIILASLIMLSLFLFPINDLSYSIPFKEHAYKNSASQKKLNEISILNTNIEPSKLLLSYLEDSLLFLGVSDRPDQNPLKNKIILGLKNSEEITSYTEDTKLYLIAKRDQENGLLDFHFTKDQKAPFWIQATYKENQITIQAGITEKNILIDGSFNLTKTSMPSRKSSWQINETRIDPTYLTRKQIKWIGQDQFLKKHGGENFSHTFNKERLDFPDESSCFVKEGSILLWKNNCWQDLQEGDDTRDYPILYVKKIEERVIHFVLWSVEGDLKCSMTLTRYPESIGNSTNKMSLFHYLGAKSWKEFLFEIEGKRVCLRQGDWWLYTDNAWNRLSTAEDIDLYVTGKLKGDLFVVDGVKRIKSNQVLVGHIFNQAKTKVWDIEIPMKQKSSALLKETEEVEDISLIQEVEPITSMKLSSSKMETKK